MRHPADLTRWNRAGLSRFDYVDGNAVEYLEIIRQQLVGYFADPETGQCDWINPAQQKPANEVEKNNETLVERQQRLSIRNRRLLETYQQDRRDWAWEISRSFARCCHMLTERANAYANEGFLGTATQWGHVRRLVEMLDYHPAPQASASAWISIHVKDNKSGNIASGFQIRNSPPAGADKVIFETLQDVYIDAALNQLHPLGWNRSEQPLSLATASGSGSSVSTQLAEIMNKPAIYLQGIGPIQAAILDTLKPGAGFKIFDFQAFNPDEVALDIASTSLWEWKAQANYLFQFSVAGDWSSIIDSNLSEIASNSADALALLSANSVEQATVLKQKIGMAEVCLDHLRFVDLYYRDLVVDEGVDRSFVTTSWYVPSKPEVEPGEVAIIVNESEDSAEAVMINQVDEIEGEPSFLALDLLPTPAQNNWSEWARGDALLHYSSRWHKKCWLNGVNVIRTQEAHGLSAESYVGWKVGDRWHYAEVIEADKRDLRLDYTGAMPVPGRCLYQLSPIEGNQAASNLEVVVLLGDVEDGGDELNPVEDATMDTTGMDDIFTIKDLSSMAFPSLPSLFPPAALPGIGSFLFPGPFLPVDLVKAAVELMLSLGLMQIPSTGEFVIKGFPPDGMFGGLDLTDAASQLYDFLELLEADGEKIVDWTVDDELTSKQELKKILQQAAQGDTPLFQEIREGIEKKGPMLALPDTATTVAKVAESDPLYMFDSTPDRIKTGNWVVAEFTDGLRGLRINQIEKFVDKDKTESFSLSFENLPVLTGELKRVHADFRGELVPYQAKINLSKIDPDNFQLDKVPETLTVGRAVLITGCGDPYQTRVSFIEGNQVSFNPPLSPCLAGNMIIHGNVVLAGHGESEPEKIIGSGNAATSNQEFNLEVAGHSFIPDATKNAGVAAAIDVEVAGRVWEQISSLKDSLADDHHYEIRMTEDGFVKIIFGDGRNGRRLPGGKNNIRVRYRVGSGIVGNLPADSLNKAIKPSPLIESVAQPIASSGGGDMEDQASLRENAPPTLLALKRAVSLSDFSHLAAAQSNIWQAKAFSELLHAGRLQKVTVIVVPAGGVFSPEIKIELENYLQKHTLPAVLVCVESYTPSTVDLKVTIRVDSDAFIPQEIESAVEVELIRQLALQYRGLGEPLYLSEIYKIVENIEGVENSICKLNDGVSVVRAADRSKVVHLDVTAGSSLNISNEEYRP